MKILKLLASTLVLLVAFSTHADFAGKWDINLIIPDMPEGSDATTMVFNIRQDEEGNYSGDMENSFGQSMEFSEISVEENEFEITITFDMGGQTVTMSFSGELEDEKLSGTADFGEAMGSFEFTGTQAKEEEEETDNGDEAEGEEVEEESDGTSDDLS